MGNTKSKNDVSKEILNRLTALDGKVDKGFKETDKRFKEAAEFRQKTEGSFANLIQEIGGIGSMLYDKIEGNHKEFLQFQQETRAFQHKTEIFMDEMRIFKQQALDFQAAMHNTIQHITRVLERIEQNLSILEDAYKQLKIEMERLTNENAAQIATIKKLEQRIVQLEAAQNLH
jgi:hypothetical protein